jgi:integrase/recombinase XerD
VVLESVDADVVVRYVSGRSAFRARATVSSVVSEVRCMGEFLVREGIWRTNPLRWMKGPKLDPRMQIPRRIGRAELRAIWAAAGRRRAEFARYQAVCVLAILYATGLRRGELVRLDVEDWDRDNGLLKIDGRKTGCERQVPVSQGVWRCIEAYLPHRHNLLERSGNVDERALLVGRNGQRLSGHAVSRMIQQLAKSAGVARVSLHRFRHSCASDLLEEGVSVAEVQRFLGHASIQSTVRYVQIADPERGAAIAKHPINELLLGDAAESGAS